MKNIILLLFISQIGISQSVKLEGVTYIMPSTEGDIECVLLTKKDFQELQVALTQLNNGNNTKSFISEWDVFKDALKFFSESKFNSEYKEKDLVNVAITRELLPDWLKSTKGKKTDKVEWFQNNKGEIDKY